MKAQTKLNITLLCLVLFGPILSFAGISLLIYLLRTILPMTSEFLWEEWIMAGMISIPFTLMVTLPLWLICGIIFITIDVDDDIGPRKTPTKWDEPNPELEALLQWAPNQEEKIGKGDKEITEQRG